MGLHCTTISALLAHQWICSNAEDPACAGLSKGLQMLVKGLDTVEYIPEIIHLGSAELRLKWDTMFGMWQWGLV